jgi:hypothetical protein
MRGNHEGFCLSDRIQRRAGNNQGISLARVVFVVAFAGIVISGLALVAISFACYSMVNGVVESLKISSTHRAGLFSQAAYHRIILNLRVLAAGAFLVAAAVFRFRAHVEDSLDAIFQDFFQFASGQYRDATQFIHAEALHAWVLCILCVEALIVRVRYLFLPVRYDEAFTYLYYARKPLIVGMSFYSAPNNHVFHTVLVHFAVLVLGNHPWAFRLPALAAGILLLPCSYAAVRRLYGRSAALLTAAFLAASEPLVEYSTNARGYTIVCLCFVMLIWLGGEVLSAESVSRWICFVGVAAVGFYTIPIMLYPFAMVVAWTALGAWRLRLRAGFFLRLSIACGATVVAAAMLYLPVIVVSGRSALFSNRFVQSRSWSYFFSNILQSFVSTWKSWNAAIPYALAVVLLLAFLLGVVFEGRMLRAPASLLVGLIPVALVLVGQRVVPFERVWLFLIPLYFGVASAGMMVLVRSVPHGEPRLEALSIAIGAMVIAIGLSLWLIKTNAVYEADQGKDSEAVAELLKGRLKPGDRVMAEAPYDVPLEYYLEEHEVPTNYLFSDVRTANELFVVAPMGQTPERVLNEMGEPAGRDWEPPALIGRFKETNLFEVGRMKMVEIGQ